MRIGQQNILSQAGYSGIKRTGGVSMPDYNNVMNYTKSSPAMSDEAYTKAIVEQAKKDFESGKFQNDSHGFNSLIKSYVSVVSPDRKSIIAEGLSEISKKKIPQLEAVSLVEIMLGKGSVKFHKKDNDLTYADFYDPEGNLIANYSNGMWTELRTPAEAARQIECCSIYNEAWGDAKRAAASAAGGNTPAGSSADGSFEQLV